MCLQKQMRKSSLNLTSAVSFAKCLDESGKQIPSCSLIYSSHKEHCMSPFCAWTVLCWSTAPKILWFFFSCMRCNNFLLAVHPLRQFVVFWFWRRSWLAWFCITPTAKQNECIKCEYCPGHVLGTMAFTPILLQARLYNDGGGRDLWLGVQFAYGQYFIDMVV